MSRDFIPLDTMIIITSQNRVAMDIAFSGYITAIPQTNSLEASHGDHS